MSPRALASVLITGKSPWRSSLLAAEPGELDGSAGATEGFGPAEGLAVGLGATERLGLAEAFGPIAVGGAPHAVRRRTAMSTMRAICFLNHGGSTGLRSTVGRTPIS
jgi:hypothetical protein